MLSHLLACQVFLLYTQFGKSIVYQTEAIKTPRRGVVSIFSNDQPSRIGAICSTHTSLFKSQFSNKNIPKNPRNTSKPSSSKPHNQAISNDFQTPKNQSKSTQNTYKPSKHLALNELDRILHFYIRRFTAKSHFLTHLKIIYNPVISRISTTIQKLK